MSSFLPLLLLINSQSQHILQCHPEMCYCPCCHHCLFVCPVCLEENSESCCTFLKSSTATAYIRKVIKAKEWAMGAKNNTTFTFKALGSQIAIWGASHTVHCWCPFLWELWQWQSKSACTNLSHGWTKLSRDGEWHGGKKSFESTNFTWPSSKLPVTLTLN